MQSDTRLARGQTGRASWNAAERLAVKFRLQHALNTGMLPTSGPRHQQLHGHRTTPGRSSPAYASARSRMRACCCSSQPYTTESKLTDGGKSLYQAERHSVDHDFQWVDPCDHRNSDRKMRSELLLKVRPFIALCQNRIFGPLGLRPYRVGKCGVTQIN